MRVGETAVNGNKEEPASSPSSSRFSLLAPPKGYPSFHLFTPTAVALLVLLSFALRAYHLDFQSFWRDEVDTVIFAGETLPSLLAKFTRVGENGPLYFTILHYWIALAGSSEFAVRFFSASLGVIAVPLTYVAGARIVGRSTGLMAAFVATLSPYYLWYSQEAKMYALLAALSLLSVYLFLRALESNRLLLWLLFVVVTSLSLYVHFFSALIMVGEAAIFLAGFPRYRNRVKGFAISMAALTLPYLPLAVWQLPMLANPPASPYEFMNLDAMGTTLLFAFSVGFTGGANVVALVLFVFLLLCAAILGRAENAGATAGSSLPASTPVDGEVETKPPSLPLPAGSRWPMAVLLLYLLAPLLAFYVISLRYPLFTERYLIIILPAFQILAGAGLHAIRQRSAILFVFCSTLVVIFSWSAIYTLQHTPIKSDFRAAVRYFEANARPNDAIMTVMPYMRRSFDYYHRGAYRWIDPPYTNQGAAEGDVSAGMRSATGGVKGLWVFVAEEDFWDQRGLVRGWLDEQGRLTDDREFAGVKLRRYELR